MTKHEFRKLALAARTAVPDPIEKSSRIWMQLETHFSLSSLAWISCYIGIQSEVSTADWIRKHLSAATLPSSAITSQIAIPVCAFTHRPVLDLYCLEDWAQLTTAKFGLLELAAEYQTLERRVCPQQIDLFLVPGLAFDRTGVRLGYGKGYYDHLLSQRRADSLTIGLAFSAQIFPHVPHDPQTDVRVDLVITEEQVIDCRT